MAKSRYQSSAKWLARARRVTPLGAQTRSKAAVNFVEGAFPAILADANGPYVWDVDRNCYTDFIMGLGAVGIGHESSHAYSGSPSYSLPHFREVEYAEALIEQLGWPDQVRFVKTGSEATEAAMRIARVATGRDQIWSVGYHGWHTLHDSAFHHRAGVPERFDVNIDYPYGEWLEFAFNVTAAVIIEPVLHQAPPQGYLESLRNECTRTGTLLIFDEVVSGFRWAIGGASEYFKVQPDLACYGKAMANGWPLACVVGKRELMEEGGKYISGTFGGEVNSLVMAHRTLQRYQIERVIEDIWGAGERLQQGFNQAAETLKAPFAMRGYPCKPYIEVTTDDPEKSHISLLLQEAAARGVLLHPTSLCVSASHARGDVIKWAVDALYLAMRAITKGVELHGLPSRPVFKRT